MIALAKKDIPTRDVPIQSRDELESEWHQARERFDQALVQKTETDRIYMAAANRLNSLERLIQKLERREATAKRDANRLLR